MDRFSRKLMGVMVLILALGAWTTAGAEEPAVTDVAKAASSKEAAQQALTASLQKPLRANRSAAGRADDQGGGTFAHWEIEAHTGAVYNADKPAGGSSQIPQTFPENAELGLVGGTGTFFNDPRTANPAPVFLGDAFGQFSQGIGERLTGWDIGGRVGYNFESHPHFGVEFTYDVDFSDYRFEPNPTLVDAFLLETVEMGGAPGVPGTVGPPTTFVFTLDEHGGTTHQFAFNGVIHFLPVGEPIVPYVTAGVGITYITGFNMSAVGVFDSVPGDIQQTMTVDYDSSFTSFMVNVGGGVKWYLNDRWGLRVDVRDYITPEITFKQFRTTTLNCGGDCIDSTGATRTGDFSNARQRSFDQNGNMQNIAITGGIFARF